MQVNADELAIRAAARQAADPEGLVAALREALAAFADR